MSDPAGALRANVRTLYVVHVLSNAQFHLVVYTLFLLGKGFSTEQFFLIESAYALVSLLMEIPTGAFSDRKSRKWSLIAASAIGAPVVPVIILSDSFSVVLIAMAVGGASTALASGTDVAILYDTLQAQGRQDEFTAVTGRLNWYGSLSMAVSGILGGLLARWDLAYAWWAYFATGLLALVAKLALVEPPFYRSSDAHESYMQHLGVSLRLSFRSDAAYFVLYGAVIWLFFSLSFWLWQPYLAAIAIPVAWFGVIYAALNVLGGLVSRQAHRIEGWLGMRGALLAIPLALALSLALQSRTFPLWGAGLLVVNTVASGAYSPLVSGYLNARIPSARRATVLSVQSLANRVLFMTLSPLLGRLIDARGLSPALLAMGIALAVAAAAFAVAYRRRPGAPTPS